MTLDLVVGLVYNARVDRRNIRVVVGLLGFFFGFNSYFVGGDVYCFGIVLGVGVLNNVDTIVGNRIVGGTIYE